MKDLQGPLGILQILDRISWKFQSTAYTISEFSVEN